MFSYKRLCLARQRRRLTAKALADVAGVTAVTISRLENGENTPDDDTLSKLAKALKYPVEFFFLDDPEPIDAEAVSFRSLSKMRAGERDAALAAGQIGLDLSVWVEKRFKLPDPDLPDFSYETDPEVAARSLRQYWAIGEKPIGNMIRLLETKGIRVFSLSENTASVDAFSFWRDEKPYVFLNNFKTAEHSIWDSAHELGHLVLHRHAGTQPNTNLSRNAEREANRFASAFLMPRNDVRARVGRPVNVKTILKAKERWRVSAMAMAYRLRSLEHLTEWQYKSICIELGRLGYRNSEPNGIERETSAIWQKVLTQLWSERTTQKEMAADLKLPQDELESLIWGLTGVDNSPKNNSPTNLQIIK